MPPQMTTCAGNANKHPGDILQQEKRKRRMKAEIEQDNRQKEEKRNAEECARVKRYKHITSLEDKMAAADIGISSDVLTHTRSSHSSCARGHGHAERSGKAVPPKAREIKKPVADR
jgi:hypothetical protein